MDISCGADRTVFLFEDFAPAAGLWLVVVRNIFLRKIDTGIRAALPMILRTDVVTSGSPILLFAMPFALPLAPLGTIEWPRGT